MSDLLIKNLKTLKPKPFYIPSRWLFVSKILACLVIEYKHDRIVNHLILLAQNIHSLLIRIYGYRNALQWEQAYATKVSQIMSCRTNENVIDYLFDFIDKKEYCVAFEPTDPHYDCGFCQFAIAESDALIANFIRALKASYVSMYNDKENNIEEIIFSLM